MKTKLSVLFTILFMSFLLLGSNAKAYAIELSSLSSILADASTKLTSIDLSPITKRFMSATQMLTKKISLWNILPSDFDPLSLDGVIGYKVTIENGISVYNLEYSDTYSVIRAYKNKLLLNKLNKRQRELYDYASAILDNIIKKDMTPYERTLAIHDYIVANYKYDEKISGIESFEAIGMFKNGKGVCNAYAQAVYLLLNMVDVECIFVYGIAGNAIHTWNIVRLDPKGGYYHIDATWDDPVPDISGRVRYDYFLVDDKTIADDHYWLAENYPECTLTDNGK